MVCSGRWLMKVVLLSVWFVSFSQKSYGQINYKNALGADLFMGLIDQRDDIVNFISKDTSFGEFYDSVDFKVNYSNPLTTGFTVSGSRYLNSRIQEDKEDYFVISGKFSYYKAKINIDGTYTSHELGTLTSYQLMPTFSWIVTTLDPTNLYLGADFGLEISGHSMDALNQQTLDRFNIKEVKASNQLSFLLGAQSIYMFQKVPLALNFTFGLKFRMAGYLIDFEAESDDKSTFKTNSKVGALTLELGLKYFFGKANRE